MILNDNQIRARCEWTDHPPMISPFQPEQFRRTQSGAPAISSGLSSYGYDIRLADTGLQVFEKIDKVVIDPKYVDLDVLEVLETDEMGAGTFYTLPPRAYALGVSVETFHIPHNILGICYCKSTYARCGLMVNTTPLEPGWRGQLVVELANLTDLPIKVYANEGIAQVVFFEGDQPSVTYADRSGKYQDQKGIVTARI